MTWLDSGEFCADSNMAMVLLVITIFNVAHIAANYRCFCFITEMCIVGQGVLRKLVHLALILNSAANPIVYAFLKKDIRRELLYVLKSPNYLVYRN